MTLIHPPRDNLFILVRRYYHLHSLMEKFHHPRDRDVDRVTDRNIVYIYIYIYSLKYTHRANPFLGRGNFLAPPRLAGINIVRNCRTLPDNAARIAALYIFRAQSTAKEWRNLGKTFPRYRL